MEETIQIGDLVTWNSGEQLNVIGVVINTVESTAECNIRCFQIAWFKDGEQIHPYSSEQWYLDYLLIKI